jgi:calcineurin-like phosphoesterase family protein
MIKACNRPFADAEEMTQALADNINNKVSRDDWLYHLGDWAFGDKRDRGSKIRNAIRFREMINCRNIVLIFGNHDYTLRFNRDFQNLFRKTADIYEVDDREVKQKIFLCHYPLMAWNASHWGRWLLHAHSHGRMAEATKNMLAHDVGVDCNNYTPLSSLEVGKIMQDKWDQGVRPARHHDRTEDEI